MRSALPLLLAAAATSAACGGKDAGYRAPDYGCEEWSFCDAIETRGRFDALEGFLRAGEVVAYRDLRPDGSAAAWCSTPGGEEAIAPWVARSPTSLRSERAEVLVAVPRGENLDGYDHALLGGRVDLRLWRPGADAELLAEDVVPASGPSARPASGSGPSRAAARSSRT